MLRLSVRGAKGGGDEWAAEGEVKSLINCLQHRKTMEREVRFFVWTRLKRKTELGLEDHLYLCADTLKWRVNKKTCVSGKEEKTTNCKGKRRKQTPIILSGDTLTI